MSEPVTTIAVSSIATLTFQKLIESGAGKLAKTFTGTAIAKMDELCQKILDGAAAKTLTLHFLPSKVM